MGTGADVDDDGDVDVDDTVSTTSGSHGNPAKRRRLNINILDEYVDLEGIGEAQSQLDALLGGAGLDQRQRERAQFFLEFLQQILHNFEPDAVDGPRDILCRRLRCIYERKAAIGRLYTANTKTMPDWSKDQAPRAICLQGAPKELRPFLCGRLCRDYDMKNAQPQLLRQLARQLEWHPPRAPPALPELEDWCEHRDAFVAHVAEVHALPPDAERWEDYRKEEVKELVISLVFGGVYEGWLRKRASTRRRPRRARPRLCGSGASSPRCATPSSALAALGAARGRAARAPAPHRPEGDRRRDRPLRLRAHRAERGGSDPRSRCAARPTRRALRCSACSLTASSSASAPGGCSTSRR